MEELFLRLENVKNKYVKKLDPNYDDFEEYLDEKYASKNAIFYLNVLNQIIIFKLLRNYDNVPDKIIDFFEKQNFKLLPDCVPLAKGTKKISEEEHDRNQNKHCDILREIRKKYVGDVYGKFIPSNGMLDLIYKYTKDKKVSILADKPNFLKYILRRKYQTDIHNYDQKDDFDVLILYEEKDKEIAIQDILKNKTVILVTDNVYYDSESVQNFSLLTEYNTVVIMEQNQYSIESKLKFYTGKLSYSLKPEYKKIAIDFFKKLIEYKYHRNDKNNAKNLLKFLTNEYYPKFKQLIEKDPEAKFFSFDFMREIFIPEYSWSTPDLKIISEIVKFVGKKKILEVASGTGFWSYLFKSYSLDVVSTGTIKKEWNNDVTEKWIDVENIKYEEAFKKYDDAEVLFLCWGISDFSIGNFKGKYVIVVGEYDGCTFFIENDNERYKLIKKMPIRHVWGHFDDLYIYEKLF